MNAASLYKEFRALPNLYDYMGVVTDADEKTLKKAFRALTLKYHPDLNPEPGSAEKFIVLKRAHEILEDGESRKLYNQYLEELKQKKLSKEAISEKRKYFADLLKKREEEARGGPREQEKSNDDLVQDFLRKKRMTKNVETIYEDFGQKEVNEVLEAQRKNKEELKKNLATLKVKWVQDGNKSYTKILMKMIFSRFGDIQEMDFQKDKCKCFIQFAEVRYADAALKYMEEHSDLKVKYLVSENRGKVIEKTHDKTSVFDLTSETLNKISGLYNGYSFTERRSQLEREVERQRQIKLLIDKQVNESTSASRTNGDFS